MLILFIAVESTVVGLFLIIPPTVESTDLSIYLAMYCLLNGAAQHDKETQV